MVAILMITAMYCFGRCSVQGPVTVMRIQGAIAAYLSIGASWAHAYHIAALLDPGAFNAAGSELSANSKLVQLYAWHAHDSRL